MARKEITIQGQEAKEASKLFKDFHGQPPQEAIQVEIDTTIPKTLVIIGKIVAIEYEPLTGKKRGKLYRHTFGDTGNRMVKATQFLCSDPEGKRFFIIRRTQRKCIRNLTTVEL